jgi:nickel-dependent lactate racemase
MVLYQSTKGLINMSLALEEGGVGILIAACEEGIGDDSLLNWLRLGSQETRETRLRENFTVPGVIAYIYANIVHRATIILVSRLDPEVVREFGMIPASSPQEAINLACEWLDQPICGYVMPKASITVPIVT